MMAFTAPELSWSKRLCVPPETRFIWPRRSMSFSLEARASMYFCSTVMASVPSLRPRRLLGPPWAMVTMTMSLVR